AAVVQAGSAMMNFHTHCLTAVTEAYEDELQEMNAESVRGFQLVFAALIGERPVTREVREVAERLNLPLNDSYMPFVIALKGSARAPARAERLRSRGVIAFGDRGRVVGVCREHSEIAAQAEEAHLYCVGPPQPTLGLAEALEE